MGRSPGILVRRSVKFEAIAATGKAMIKPLRTNTNHYRAIDTAWIVLTPE